ncbi:MAG: hypothetical protein U0670_03175 [Anaerolineae bacterium]
MINASALPWNSRGDRGIEAVSPTHTGSRDPREIDTVAVLLPPRYTSPADVNLRRADNLIAAPSVQSRGSKIPPFGGVKLKLTLHRSHPRRLSPCGSRDFFDLTRPYGASVNNRTPLRLTSGVRPLPVDALVGDWLAVPIDGDQALVSYAVATYSSGCTPLRLSRPPDRSLRVRRPLARCRRSP